MLIASSRRKPCPSWSSSGVNSARLEEPCSNAVARFSAASTTGLGPTFLTETSDVRAGDWSVAAAPTDLNDRRVEITGPVERKMMINALNSGARVFMADFEDAAVPALVECHSRTGELYGRYPKNARVRQPGGKALPARREARNPGGAAARMAPGMRSMSELDGEAMSASLVDFGLYFFHNARELLARGSGPYFYLPKLESYLEARLWNDVFRFAQDELGIPRGTIRATVLIETILAAFQMDEILYELREHAAGLNAGRWDYLFSIIKNFRDDPAVSPA